MVVIYKSLKLWRETIKVLATMILHSQGVQYKVGLSSDTPTLPQVRIIP